MNISTILTLCVAILSAYLISQTTVLAEEQKIETPGLSVAKTLSRKTSNGLYISWKEHLIDDEAISGIALRGADGLKVADLNGDSYLDIVSVHEDSSHVRIAFGTGDPLSWESCTLGEGDRVGAAEDISIADLNKDGLLDIVIAAELEHLIYFQNPGMKESSKCNWPSVIPAVTQGNGSWIKVYTADLDNDGSLEVIAPNKGEQMGEGSPIPTNFPPKPISIFRIIDDPLKSSSWKEIVVTKMPVPINSKPIDLDSDGDLDLVGGSRYEARLFWYESPKLENTEFNFTERPVDVSGRNYPWQRGPRRLTGMNMEFADLNEDGRLDIVLQESTSINVWLEQPSSLDIAWTIHLIGDITPDRSTGLLLLDIDSDGDLDLFNGGYSGLPRDRDGDHVNASSPTGRLAWFENPGSPTNRWIRHDISRRVRGMFDEFIAQDIDGDGDLDIIGTRGNSGSFDGLFWLEQVRRESPTRVFTPARTIESRHLPLPP
ncbi:MAG: hypothetical protein CMQ20_17950 [Gammaproteobacteria bacterium]|jgi:hypothetical protein|nr:hypothetical protein [Gammaproteobacteria bacterium]|tara:strand:- start:1744 stop:3207 length:1464 start_codon:yes stop_codon:yes gene_type:complete